MFAKLFPRFGRSNKRLPKVEDSQRIYAVGDVHGRLDCLDALLKNIRIDEAARGGTTGQLIFLGDLVDRGPASAGVIDRLLELKEQRPDTRFLMGNHEEVFLAAARGDPKAARLFVRIGGIYTLRSYGMKTDISEQMSIDDIFSLCLRLVPDRHLLFLSSFEDMIVIGDYAFVHAGVRPGIPLNEQTPVDLRWIREEFLRSRASFEKIVVHGHTIVPTVEERSNRIAVDTGAWRSGILTAMAFEGERRWSVEGVCSSPPSLMDTRGSA